MSIYVAPDRAASAPARTSSDAELPLAAYTARLPSAAPLLAAAETDRELAARLMALPPMERRAAALHDPLYRRPTLAQLLALRAESGLFDPRVDPRPAAELAAALASGVPRDPGGKARRASALAYWLLGKALLRAHQWRLAGAAFQGIFAFIPEPGPSEERGLATVGRAQLRADTGDLDAAVAQYLLAAQWFSRLGAAHAVAACQAQLGLLLLDGGDLVNARISLRVAAGLLDPAFAPSLAARLRLALAEVASVLEGGPAGSADLDRARALYRLAPCGETAPESLERRWREARIAAAAGDGAAAAALLEPVRRELLARGSLVEAARCTFEHLLLRIDGRRSSDVRDLTDALAAAFPGAGARWAEQMAHLARLVAADPDGVYAPCSNLRRRLRLAVFPDPARPPLLIPARMLADRVLRRRGECEDPVGAAGGSEPLPDSMHQELA